MLMLSQVPGAAGAVEVEDAPLTVLPAEGRMREVTEESAAAVGIGEA